jgi:hypothetical protein
MTNRPQDSSTTINRRPDFWMTTSQLPDSSMATASDCSTLCSTMVEGASAHGTFCAGLLVAVAPDATVMPLRAFDDNGNTDLFTLAKAIRYARKNGAQVVNMSFGTLSDAKVLRDAIEYAKAGNVLLVASAGNNDTSSPQYPAAYPGVIAGGGDRSV